MRKGMFWTVSLGMVLVAGLVLADDESDRATVGEIEQLLGRMANDLGYVLGDSGTGYVDSALSNADEVKTRANRLGSTSDTAKAMSSYYPGYVDKFKESARSLKLMKDNQRSLDELPRKCEDKTRELVAALRGYTDSNDPRGFEAVPKLARDYGRFAKEALEQAERVKYEMYKFYDKVDDFSETHGRWGDVKERLIGAGAGIWSYFLKPYESMKRDDVCGNLAKEDRNPLVEEAMKKLLEGKRGIELLYDAIDRQLGELASYLNRLESDSNASDVDSAERKAEDLERNVEQLDRIRGQDGEARRRVDLYRNLLRVFRDSMKQLRTLKQGQFLADLAPEQCRAVENKLIDVIAGYKNRRDAKGVKEIPLSARAAAEPVKMALAKADEYTRVMESAKNEALRFDSGEGRWREVRSNLKDSADAIWAYWKRAIETAHKSCDEIAKGEEMQLVKAALEFLKGSSKTLIEAYRKDVDAWFDLTREAFKVDCDGLQEIWSATCEGVDWEKDASIGKARAEEISNRIRASREPVGRQLLEMYEQLKVRGEQLTADDEISEQAKTLLGQMNKRRWGAVEKMIKNGAVLGYQHPLVQFAQRYGVERHLEMMSNSSYACDVADEGIDGTGEGEDPGRPDCISADHCMIYEFKPDSPSGKDAYSKQESRYLRGVREFFEKHLVGGTVPSIRGGQQIIEKLKKNSSCWDANAKKLNFQIKMAPYKVCEKKYECVYP